MTLASDQKIGYEGLSENSKRMIELRDVVFSKWEERVRQTVEKAGDLAHPIIINTLPTLYDNIAQSISPGYPRTSASDGNTVASEHGGERARITQFGAQEVIAEYQVLRWVVLEVLHEHQVRLSTLELNLVNSSIDSAIRESVTAFAETQAAFRRQMIATLTHDLRNPLHAAALILELIASNAVPERHVELAEKARGHLTRANDLVSELLNSSAISVGTQGLRIRPSQFDLLDLARDVIGRWPERERVELHGSNVEGWWDRGLVERALENLLGNAFKYGDPSSPVRVRILSCDERVLLSVHNEGKPIPGDELPTLFRAYQRAKDSQVQAQEGWGLGLTIVRSAAECHGGSIEVDSGVGRGTTFTLDMPVDSRPFAIQRS